MNFDRAKRVDRVLGSLLGGVVGSWDALRGSRAPVDHVRGIVMTKFWGLGNQALLRPVYAALRQAYPSATLAVVTFESNRVLAEDLVDEVVAIRSGSMLQTTRDLVRAMRTLRAGPYDMALDFEQFARSGALLARFAGIPHRVGFRSGQRARDGLYTATVPFHGDRHAARSFLDLAEAGGVPAGAYDPASLSVDPSSRAALAARVPGSGPWVVLHPGSGDNFPGRRWSPRGFEAVGRAALQSGRRVLVTGGASERPLVEEVAAGIGAGATALAGTLDLPMLIAAVGDADALVSNDTGPVHVASALGTPTLAIYGPNTPVLFGPLAAGSEAISMNLPCSPCLTNANYRSSRCRLHVCMSSIATGRVVAALTRILEAPRVKVGDEG